MSSFHGKKKQQQQQQQEKQTGSSPKGKLLVKIDNQTFIFL